MEKTKTQIKPTRCFRCKKIIIDLNGKAPFFCNDCRPTVEEEIIKAEKRLFENGR